MPKKQNYPSWFHEGSKPSSPYKPEPPEETVEIETEVARLRLVEHNPISDIEEFFGKHAQKIAFLHHKKNYDGDDCDSYLVAYAREKEPNPEYKTKLNRYKTALSYYEKKLEEHKTRAKQWKELKAKWDAEEKEEQRERDLKLLTRLKKEYPDAN